MCATIDRPTTAATALPPQERKDTWLPLITRLALEGHSGRTIARTLELPVRTVNHWLREVRREWAAKTAEETAEMLALALARLDAIYREAMEAFRASQADKETQLVTETETADGRPKKKQSVRTQSQSGNAAFLAKAIEAVNAICLLMGGGPLPRIEGAGQDDALTPVEPMAPKDSEALTDRWKGLAQVTGLLADPCYGPSSVNVTPKGSETPVFSAVS